MSKPKIFHLFNAFQVGGAERQHMEHVRRLAESFEQICWAPCSGPIEKELDELDIPHLAGGPEKALTLLEKEDFDCIVMRTNWHFDALEHALANDPAPVIFIKEYLRWYQGNDQYIDPSYDARAVDLADLILFVGPSLQSGMHALGLKEKNGAMLFNGIDITTMPMRTRRFPSGPLRVGMLANIVPRKNQLGAINTLAGLLSNSNMQLIIGGAVQDRCYGQKVHQAAQGLKVRLCGYVSDPASFLSGVDLLLNTSTLEGWPVSIMEAMACGVPVIAPDIGDIPMLLDHGRAGIIYDPADISALPSLIDRLQPAAYEYFSEQGIERIHEFDINHSACQLRDMIHNTITMAKSYA